jgi:putative DNA primase/helicase
MQKKPKVKVKFVTEKTKTEKQEIQIFENLEGLGTPVQNEDERDAKNKGRVSEWLQENTSGRLGTPFELSDSGNANRFVDLYGWVFKYNWDSGKWLFWDATRWITEGAEAYLYQRALKRARSIREEANLPIDKNDKEKVLKWALHSEQAIAIREMLSLARSSPLVTTNTADYDRNPWLLNCLSGTIDLKTGEIREHKQEDLITRLCPTLYTGETDFDLWQDFLKTACDDDNELIEFLQRAVGYSLTGDTREEKLFFVHGGTATGKSTFLEAIKSTLGDYSHTADFESFLKRSSVGGPRSDIAQMCGARMVVSIEVEEGKNLAEGLVKTLTGGDRFRARHLYKEGFEFEPQFKLWLAANHAPHVNDLDAAMWRRILRIPFEHVIPEKERDPKIKAMLKNPKIAGPTILAWAVEGCLKWQQDGLKVPAKIKAATEKYKLDMDPLKEFFEECCQFGQQYTAFVVQLREAYDRFCRENGQKYPLGQRKFNERLRERGCVEDRKGFLNQRLRCWRGIGLK